MSTFSSQDSKRLRFCNFFFKITTFIFQDIAFWRFCSVPNCGSAVALPTETTPFMETLKLPECMTSRWAKHRCSKHTKRRWTAVADCARATSELDKHAIYVEHQPASAGGPIVHMHAFYLFQISVTFHSRRRSYPDHKQKGAMLNFAFSVRKREILVIESMLCLQVSELCLWSHRQVSEEYLNIWRSMTFEVLVFLFQMWLFDRVRCQHAIAGRYLISACGRTEL